MATQKPPMTDAEKLRLAMACLSAICELANDEERTGQDRLSGIKASASVNLYRLGNQHWFNVFNAQLRLPLATQETGHEQNT